MKIINKQLTEIMPYEKNPRNNVDAVDKVAASISEFGFKQPIVIDAAGVIVVGHTRYLAAKKLGYEEVPCVIADDLSPYQIKAYRLADNKVAEFSDWDFTLLNQELDELLDFDMDSFGFSEELEEIEGPEEVSDAGKDTLNMETVIVIKCPTEEELEKAFEKLNDEGYECQLLTL